MQRNAAEGLPVWVDENPDVTDFYDENDIYTPTNVDRNFYNEMLASLEDWEREALERAVAEDKAYYVLEFSNIGGLVMPILLQIDFADGSQQNLHIPAEIWRRNTHQVRKLLVYDKGTEITQITVDPNWETGDADVENNYYPRRMIPSRVEAFKYEREPSFIRKDIMNDIRQPLVDPETAQDEDSTSDPETAQE